MTICTGFTVMSSKDSPALLNIWEGVHLIFRPHIFSIQVKSGACYITGQWG